ncbi:transmembrane transporter [Diaporthe amygdali]|uniref:transmembrane transporter n=1 Tax=Phomopsis amygdali TaxID=1214568 RepID=UPI0022FE3903|nr:transmembrane transporter [Diaporthe amygdali]KAJ0124918.1 transmembrane transporter [Diaporthe amygdali]
MAEARSQHHAGSAEAASTRDPEAEALLFDDDGGSSDGDDDIAKEQKQDPAATGAANGATRPPGAAAAAPAHGAMRTPSSPGTPTPPGQRTPRTPQRVRFDPNPTILHGRTPNGTADSFDSQRRGSSSSDQRDSFDDLDFDIDGGDGGDGQHRRPLLTGIEAPSVALANGPWGGEHEDADSWAESERQRPKSGLRAAFMNMANSIIGAGIIGQPYAFKQAGLLSGVVLLVGLTVVVDWTICLIVVNSKLSGANSFQGTVEHCFGRSGLIAISLAQWLFAFGGMVAFGVIVGDTIPHVLQAVWPGLSDMPVLGILADRRAVIVIFILGVSYPLTLYRDIAKLAKASTLALISMVVILVTVIIQGILVPSEDRGSFSTPLLTVNTAFVCHHNSLLIYGSLKTPTIDRFSRVTHFSTGVSMLACLLMALAGFITFGDKTLGNILNNFPADNTMVNIARLCLGLNMLTTLPLEAFVCREVMLNYYFPGEPFNMHLHLIFSTSLVVSATVLSVMTCDLGSVFELVGATSACAMAYILPPLCYIKLSSRSWKTYVAVAIVVFGCGVMVISTLLAVKEVFHNVCKDNDAGKGIAYPLAAELAT